MRQIPKTFTKGLSTFLFETHHFLLFTMSETFRAPPWGQLHSRNLLLEELYTLYNIGEEQQNDPLCLEALMCAHPPNLLLEREIDYLVDKYITEINDGLYTVHDVVIAFGVGYGQYRQSFCGDGRGLVVWKLQPLQPPVAMTEGEVNQFLTERFVCYLRNHQQSNQQREGRYTAENHCVRRVKRRFMSSTQSIQQVSHHEGHVTMQEPSQLVASIAAAPQRGQPPAPAAALPPHLLAFPQGTRTMHSIQPIQRFAYHAYREGPGTIQEASRPFAHVVVAPQPQWGQPPIQPATYQEGTLAPAEAEDEVQLIRLANVASPLVQGGESTTNSAFNEIPSGVENVETEQSAAAASLPVDQTNTNEHDVDSLIDFYDKEFDKLKCSQ